MSKTSLFIIGLLVFALAAGGMWYRVAGDPGAMARYDWVLEQAGLRKPQERAPAGSVSQPAKKDAGERSLSRDGGTSDRIAARRDRQQKQDRLELFKLGLDLANILVGLIGIYLAVSGMRMRRDSQSQG